MKRTFPAVLKLLYREPGQCSTSLYMHRRLLPLTVLGVLLLSTACSSLPGRGSARNADFEALHKTLQKERLRPRQVRRLSREVLSAEIIRAKDREDRPFVSALGGCSRQLSRALETRARTRDGVGAEAALLLLEDGQLRGAKRRFTKEEDGAWRALSARASSDEGELRRSYFTDDDERVRRAALLAALEAADADDVEALLEVARLDPDPLTRSRAYQVLGRIGGERVALALVDRFETADEALRLAIVDAWAQPGLYKSGGRRNLSRLLTHETGFDALYAASILARDENESLRNRGINRLLAFTKEGTTDERRMAARLLPAGRKGTVLRLLQLTKSEDREVAVIATARLLGNSEHRDKAQATLLKWARESSSVGFQARSALSATGDERVLPFMKQQMRSESPQARRVAGAALVRLGAFTELAPLLADNDPNVRRVVACQVLGRAPLPAE